MKTRMDGTVRHISESPSWFGEAPAAIDDPAVRPPLSWLERRAVDLRLKQMAGNLPQKPYWNTTMVTAWVAVIVGFCTVMGMLAGMYVYTRDTSKADGIKIGRQMERDEATQKKLDDQAAEIERLKIAAGLLPPEKKERK